MKKLIKKPIGNREIMTELFLYYWTCSYNEVQEKMLMIKCSELKKPTYP